MNFNIIIFLFSFFVSSYICAEEFQDIELLSKISILNQTHETIYDNDQSLEQEQHADDKLKDRMEFYNRKMYNVNKFFDKRAFEPIAKLYKKSVPDVGKKTIRNILNNLSEPLTIFNSILQGDFVNTGRSTKRFVINSTLGFFGFFDVAGESAIKTKIDRRDFASTLAIRGAVAGDYVVLPIFGPATARDFIGRIVDLGTDPFNYETPGMLVLTKNAIDMTDKRASLLNLTSETTSLSVDEYSMIRSLYLQNQAFKIEKLKERIKKNAQKTN